MWRAMKRRSWQMELPHIGELRTGTYSLRNSSSCASASASVKAEALTFAIRPERPCVLVFHLSMASITASLWCTTSTGDSATVSSLLSVTTTAISMMRSVSGLRPVISMSSQIKLFGSCAIISRALEAPNRRAAILSYKRRSPTPYRELHRRLSRRPVRHHADAIVAGPASYAPRAPVSRRRAGRVPRRDFPGRTPEGRRLHRGQGARRAAGCARGRGAAAGPDRGRRAAMAVRCLAVAVGRRKLCARHRVHRHRRARRLRCRAAARALPHLRHRKPLRLQQDDLAPVVRRPDEGGTAGSSHRIAGAVHRAVADGGDGPLLVAVRLDLLAGLQSRGDAGLSEL